MADDPRSLRSRAEIMKAVRGLLSAGMFRPAMTDIARAADLSVRTCFQHFKSVPLLLEEAITDGVTREQIAQHVCCYVGPPSDPADQFAMVKAIVLGRVVP